LKKYPSMQLWLSGRTHDIPVHLRELWQSWIGMNGFETARNGRGGLSSQFFKQKGAQPIL
jgi:hypothetical protein